VVTKCQVLSPQFAALLDEMNVIGARLSPAKELVTRDTSIASVLVPCSRERRDVLESWHSGGVASQDVENGFGAKTWHSGASDVLDTYWEGPARVNEPLRLREKQRRPGLIVRHDAYRTRFETE